MVFKIVIKITYQGLGTASVRVRNFSSTKDPQSVRESEILCGSVRNPHISGHCSQNILEIGCTVETLST